MKNLTLLFVLLIIGLTSLSQNISNAGFENWTTDTLFCNPKHYESTNLQLVTMGSQPNISKTSDSYSGNYAVNLKTVQAGSDIVNGILSMQTPYSHSPDSVHCYAKFDIQALDSAYLIIHFSNSGTDIGYSQMIFKGNQSNYAKFSAPVNIMGTATPDSIQVMITSSNVNTNPLTISGSEITIDDIQFTGSGLAPFPNGPFEDWDYYDTEEPDNWFTSNIFNLYNNSFSINKATDVHSGNYAIKIRNKVTMWGDTISFITNGRISEEGPVGGMGVNQNPKKITGYYKYSPVNNDTAIAYAFSSRYDSVTGDTILQDSNMVKLTAENNYTYFEINLNNHAEIADTLNIAFSAGNLENEDYLEYGSSLYLDDLSVTYYPASVEEKQSKNISVYPNPASDKLFISTDKPVNCKIKIFDESGKLIKIKDLKAGSSKVFKTDISDLSSGNYFYSITGKNIDFSGKVVVN